jgi:hypothetical protein
VQYSPHDERREQRNGCRNGSNGIPSRRFFCFLLVISCRPVDAFSFDVTSQQKIKEQEEEEEEE